MRYASMLANMSKYLQSKFDLRSIPKLSPGNVKNAHESVIFKVPISVQI